jgi:hypothetical protein
MPPLQLEERVALLEMEVTELKRQLKQGDEMRVPWWDQVAGTFVDDPAFEEAMRLGRQYREAQRAADTETHDDNVPA